MGRILAIDYGLKRTGIAVTDPLRIIATPLETVVTANLFQFLTGYLQKENVDEFVVGMPKTLLNEDSEIAPMVRKFVENLKLKFGDFYLIPEGGTNELAVKGCEEILTDEDADFDFICTAVGTGGTAIAEPQTERRHRARGPPHGRPQQPGRRRTRRDVRAHASPWPRHWHGPPPCGLLPTGPHPEPTPARGRLPGVAGRRSGVPARGGAARAPRSQPPTSPGGDDRRLGGYRRDAR
jgi:putative Holliday junction resolvase